MMRPLRALTPVALAVAVAALAACAPAPPKRAGVQESPVRMITPAAPGDTTILNPAGPASTEPTWSPGVTTTPETPGPPPAATGTR